MTLSEQHKKILERAEFSENNYETEGFGAWNHDELTCAELENSRLMPIIRTLLEECQRLAEDFEELTRCICHEAYKISDLRDPSCNCLYRDTLEAHAKAMSALGGDNG